MKSHSEMAAQGVGADARFEAGVDPARTYENVSVAPLVRVGDHLIASGQVAVRDGELVATGLVGRDVDLGTAQWAAGICARNVLAAVQAELGSLNGVRVSRITVYVATAPGCTDQHLVAHGASAVMLDVLGPDRGRHARTALGLAGLPLGSPVKVDAIFELCHVE